MESLISGLGGAVVLYSLMAHGMKEPPKGFEARGLMSL